MDTPYKIENVEIVRIYKNDKDRDGKPFVSSKGNNFIKVDIYIDPRTVDDPKFEGKMTYFDYYSNSVNWEVGTTLTGEIVKNEVNDRTYFNFNLPPSGKKALELDFKELEDRVRKLEEAVFKSEEKAAIDFSKEALKEEPEEEEDMELPF